MMLKEFFQNVAMFFKPYTFEDYIKEYNPQTVHDIEQLEKQFDKTVNSYLVSPRF